MEIKTQAKIFKTKEKNPLKISIFFLSLILLITIWLYFYNYSIENKINELKKDIQTKTNSIKQLEQNKKIVISRLYNANKTSIQRLEDYSMITTYINHLYYLQRIYNINFKWFNYSNWNIKTTVLASSDWISTDYKKTYNFIKNYRENSDSLALFNLWLVKNIKEKQKLYNEFDINLSLKNNIWEILKNYNKNKQKKKEEIKKIDEQKKKEIAEKIKKLKEKIKNKEQ